jgi:hypothetical protein
MTRGLAGLDFSGSILSDDLVSAITALLCLNFTSGQAGGACRSLDFQFMAMGIRGHD